jgi:hypothetical protein
MENEKHNGVASTTKTKDLDKNNATTPSKTKDERNGKHWIIFYREHPLTTQILTDSSHSHKKKKSKDKDREKVRAIINL